MPSKPKATPEKPSQSKVYLLCEQSYGNSDEWNYTEGEPVAKEAFKDEDVARAECDRLNIEEMRQADFNDWEEEDILPNTSIDEFYSQVKDLVGEGMAQEAFGIDEGSPNDLSGFSIPKKMKDKDVLSIYNLIGLSFWSVEIQDVK